MDVATWLRGLGLGQYEAAFRDNEIDGVVLPKLTVDDLRDLGVVVVGHRRKMMLAIEALNAGSPTETSVHDGAPPGVAERRQLTVMFCDLVGSTALSTRLDPEDMREVIRAYQDVCSGAVARYDGFVAKFMGDGVLSYFGFPRAHEEDAERAVRAGLDIAAVVAKLETRAKQNSEGPHRRRDGHCCGRRSRRNRLGAGAGGRRRHAQSGRTIAGAGRTRLRRNRGFDKAAARRRVRAKAARAASAQGLRRAGSRLGGPSRGGERQPFRGVAVARHDAPHPARARTSAPDEPLARRDGRRGQVALISGEACSPRFSNRGTPGPSMVDVEMGMPAKRELSMRQLRHLLRLHHDRVSAREIGRRLGVARSTIQDNLKRAAAAGLAWPLADDVTDEALETRLYGRAGVTQGQRRRAEPDWAALARELKRPGVTMTILWRNTKAGPF